MAVHPTDAAASGLGVHGLRFLNDEWNDSISNGDSFTVRWNQSLATLGSGLGVFKVTYPKDGVVVYELISNLTGVWPAGRRRDLGSLTEWRGRYHKGELVRLDPKQPGKEEPVCNVAYRRSRQHPSKLDLISSLGS